MNCKYLLLFKSRRLRFCCVFKMSQHAFILCRMTAYAAITEGNNMSSVQKLLSSIWRLANHKFGFTLCFHSCQNVAISLFYFANEFFRRQTTRLPSVFLHSSRRIDDMMTQSLVVEKYHQKKIGGRLTGFGGKCHHCHRLFRTLYCIILLHQNRSIPMLESACKCWTERSIASIMYIY